MTFLPQKIRVAARCVLRRKRAKDYPDAVCFEGRFFYHQIVHLGEEVGCSITSLAMLLSNREGRAVSPAEIFNSNRCTCYMNWDEVTERYGYKPVIHYLNPQEDRMAAISELLCKHPEGIILSIPPKEERGHFLVVCGIEESEPPNLLVADPMGDGTSPQCRPIRLSESYTYKRFGEQTLARVERLLAVEIAESGGKRRNP